MRYVEAGLQHSLNMASAHLRDLIFDEKHDSLARPLHILLVREAAARGSEKGRQRKNPHSRFHFEPLRLQSQRLVVIVRVCLQGGALARTTLI